MFFYIFFKKYFCCHHLHNISLNTILMHRQHNYPASVMFKERFLLLSNDAAVGIFNQDRKTVFVALSINGEFVKVYEGDSSSIHLTRFSPVSVYPLVQKLLNFRNQYAHRPYLSERFLKTSSPFNGSRTISWGRKTQLQTTKNYWKIYSNGDERSLIAICPHRKKLCYLSDAIFPPDTSMSHHQAQLSSEFRVTRHVTVVPLALAPASFQRDYFKGNFLSSECSSTLDADFITEIPTSIECGASDSSSACHFFQEIEHELTFLKSNNKYPTSVDFVVKVEKIDGEIFLSTQSALNSGDQSEDIAVESWIQPPREIRARNRNILASTQMDVALEEEDAEGCNMSVEDFGCNGGGPILTLNGDYFIFYHDHFFSSGGTGVNYVNDHSMIGISIHISLLDQTCQATENATIETHVQSCNENICGNSIENWWGSETSEDACKTLSRPNHSVRNSRYSASERFSSTDRRRSHLEGERRVEEDDSSLQIQKILRRYRQHAIHLLEYRQYLQVRRKHLGASSRTPECLKSIGGETEKTRIKHFSRDKAMRTVAGRQKHYQGQGQGYGGSYYVKNNELREVFPGDADIGNSSPSCFDRYSSDIDKSSKSRSNRNCNDINVSNAHDSVKLQTSDGTRFTAYPTSETALNMHKYVSANSSGSSWSSKNMMKDEYGLACTHSEFDFYEEIRHLNKQQEYKDIHRGAQNDTDEGLFCESDQGMFCRVRGVFPDRTQLDLCLKSKVAHSLYCRTISSTVYCMHFVLCFLLFSFFPFDFFICSNLFYSALYCTVLYCNVLYSTVLLCSVLFCTLLYSTVLPCSVLYCTVLYCTVL